MGPIRDHNDVRVQRALASIASHVGDHARFPSHVGEEHQADVVMDITHISDALRGLAHGDYTHCDFCQDDHETIRNIWSAVGDIQQFAPRMGTELEAVVSVAEAMAGDPHQRAELAPKVLDALTSPRTQVIER